MANILKPRRGKKSTAIASDIKLENGEIFFEMPETGVGTGQGSIKFGDGNSVYRDLPYFFDKDAYAKSVHTHDMNQITNLNTTLTNIESNIADIVDGDITIGSAENSNKLGNKAASDYVTINGNQALTNKTYNGYTLGPASTKSVDEDTTTENSTNLITGKAANDLINTKIGQIVQIQYLVVEELPRPGQVGIIYLMLHEHGVNDIYDEYIWLNDENDYEKIGNTDIDLSGYALINHTHNYSDILDTPTIPIADGETIVSNGGVLSGSKIKVLESDPVSTAIGDMWLLSTST